MKKSLTFLMVLMVLGFMAFHAMAAGLVAVPPSAETLWAANTQVVLTDADLASTGSTTNSVTIAGPCVVEYKGFQAATPFYNQKSWTNGVATTTNSILATVTIGTNIVVSSFQTAKDGLPYAASIPTSIYTWTVTNGATLTVQTILAPQTGTVSAANLKGEVRTFVRVIR